MTATVETLPNCVAKLRVELPPERVRRERASVASDFQKYARLPGYRPGKAPLPLVKARYAKQIREELRDKLVREALNEAIREKGLEVLAVSKVQRAELGPDDVMRIEATAVVQPQFDLPDYSEIPVQAEKHTVTPDEVERVLEGFRERHATFEPVEGRPAAMGDFAVITYSATLDGRALLEAAPDAPEQLAGGRNAWLLLAEESLAPGFCARISGLESGAETSFTLPLPADFPTEALAGKSLDYVVELHSIQSKRIPPLDDALADKIEPGCTAEELRRRVADQLERLAASEFESAKRAGAIRHLLEKTTFELPETHVARETGSILREVINENRLRGISDEEIRKHQDELIGAAKRGAHERVRADFLLLKVAREEKLEASESDLTMLILELAHRYDVPVKKFVADLRKRGGLEELREQVLRRKALDLLVTKVKILPPTAKPPASSGPSD